MTTVSAFWGDRPAEHSAVASRLADCLSRLGTVDPLLSGWRPKGGSRKGAADNPIMPIDAEALAGQLKIQRRDVGREPMPELGFSFAVWNGGPDGEEAAISCTVGLHADNPNLRNSVVVKLPTGWTAVSAKVQGVVEVLCEVWEPEEVVFFGEDRSRQTLWRSSA